LAKPKPLERLEWSLTQQNLWLSILSLASRSPVYAYALPALIQKNFGFTPSRLMVYLVLYKLESEGMLTSFERDMRKYYKLAIPGKRCLALGKKELSKWAKKL